MTDTRQSRVEREATADLHAAIATERERDELRRRIDAALAALASPSIPSGDLRPLLRGILTEGALCWTAQVARGCPAFCRCDTCPEDIDYGAELPGRVCAILSGDDEPRYATAEELQDECPCGFPGASPCWRVGGEAGCASVVDPGAQPFDPKAHSDKRGTVIDR